MKDKVWETITQYDMLQQGDRVVAALSGGADSMALLAFLLELKEPLGIGVSACHVNHGLRGEESDRDEAFVRDWCRRLEVPLQVVRLEGEALRREKGGSLEEAARRARYQALEKAAAGGKIATGHTASDNLETILLNLARGTGLRGLCGIPPVRGRIIRPLIALTRREVEQYCAARAIPYCTDSTNHSREYSRNRLRQQAVPALLSVNPAAERLAGEMSGRTPFWTGWPGRRWPAWRSGRIPWTGRGCSGRTRCSRPGCWGCCWTGREPPGPPGGWSWRWKPPVRGRAGWSWPPAGPFWPLPGG